MKIERVVVTIDPDKRTLDTVWEIEPQPPIDMSRWDEETEQEITKLDDEFIRNLLIGRKNDDLQEFVAKKIAMANNGGDWAEHYNEDQKNVWRERAKEIIKLVKDNIY